MRRRQGDWPVSNDVLTAVVAARGAAIRGYCNVNISGILVVTTPEHIQAVSAQLQELDGIDVHYIDAETGRIVITQEAGTISAEVEGLKRIRALPHIILAEMSCHYFEEDPELVTAIPAELDDEGLGPCAVPVRLND
jgi:nitrate reductase NapD